MAHSFEDPLDAAAVETQRKLTVDGVKRRFKIARWVQRGMLALTVGGAIGAAAAYANDAESAPVWLAGTVPAGLVSMSAQTGAKRRSAYLVGEFLRLEAYAKSSLVDFEDLKAEDIPKVAAPAKYWYERAANPQAAAMFSHPLIGYGGYGVVAEILVDHADSVANTNATNASYVMTFAGAALYALTEHSMQVHEQALLGQLGAPESA